jgi:hypothetical protein
MAKTFYYDSVGLLESSINDGTKTSGPDDFSDASTITNESRIIDQNISLASTDWANTDALQFDLGSAKTVNFLALYFNATEGDDVSLYYSTASDTITGTAVDITDEISSGWTVSAFSNQSKRYWILASESGGGITGLTEAIIGGKLEFEMNPDVGIGEQEIYGTSLVRSLGGAEYANKLHDPISTISMNFSNVSSTFKDSLQSMEAQVTDYKKFIYSEDGTTGPFHYVRLDGPISYSEVAYQRYSASFTLREQLS